MTSFSKRGFTAGRPLHYQEDHLNSFRDLVDSKPVLTFYEGWSISGSPLLLGYSFPGVPTKRPVYLPRFSFLDGPPVLQPQLPFSLRLWLFKSHLSMFVLVTFVYIDT